jgi:predicted HTH domain antitoxin
MKTDLIKEGMNSLIRAGYYKNREKLLEDAFRTMLEVRPSVKIDMAVELYRHKEVTLSRAAEISGLPIEGFKNVLSQRGIPRVVHGPTKGVLKKGVDYIVG